MLKCPINYYENNLIFNTDKSCWGIFKLKGYDYDNRSEETKIDILHRLTRFISNVVDEAKILIIPVSQNVDEHYEGVLARLDEADPLHGAAKQHAEMTREYLKEEISRRGGNSNDYNTYVCAKLVTEDELDVINRIQDVFSYFVKDPINAVNTYFGLDARDILVSRMKHFQKLAKQFFRDQSKRIAMEKVTPRETQWLYMRMSYRGLNKDVPIARNRKSDWVPFKEHAKVGKEEVVRPYQKDVHNLFDGVVSPDEDRAIKITHEDSSESYQSFVCISHIPDGIEFPGSEWIYLLQEYKNDEGGYPAEICIHLKNVPHKDSVKKLEGKKREANNQIEHIEDANADVPDDLYKSKTQADEFEGELKEGRSPLCRVSVSICFSGPTYEAMERKLKEVCEVYEDMDFVVVRPLTDQYKLFMEFMPGSGRYVKDFVIPLPPRTLAGGVIGASRKLGDNEGPYIGTMGNLMKLVFLNMGRACLLDKSASATFFGNLGVGKSFNANLLLFLIVLYGGYGLIFDPKGERSHWAEAFPMFKDLISIVTLSTDDRYKGMLDPFVIYRDNIEEAAELAQNIVSEIYKIQPDNDEYIVLLEALEKIKNKAEYPLPSMKRLTEILESFPETDELARPARMLARKMRTTANNGMARLIFGDGTEKAIKLDNRINILQIQNLKLPSRESKKEDYTAEETLSTVLMSVLGNFAKKFALTVRDVFSCILFDESWMLGKTVEGVKLYDFLSRMGRSLFTGCIFNGHSVLDIPTEGIKNTITYKFCFQTDSTDEARRMLEYLNLEVSDENIAMVKGLENRQCLFQDLDGRVDILTFDAVFDDIISAFNTTPKEKQKQPKEEKARPERRVQKEEMLAT